MASPVTIRDAQQADARAIAELLGDLGYPAAAPAVTERLAQLDAFRNARVIVADMDGRPVGVASVHLFPSIHSATIVAWLTTLVVGSAYARQGIGRRLVHAAEDWARTRGATRLSLTSGSHRADAHAFYQHLGYKFTGVRLAKELHADGGTTT